MKYKLNPFTGMMEIDASLGAAVKGTGTLTSDGVAPADGDVVTLDAKVYTFKPALTPTEGEVLIGGSAAVALDNLKAAVNHTGTPDTDYKCAAAHATIEATTNTDTTQVFQARYAGTAANTLASTETSAHLTFGSAAFTGGADGIDTDALLAADSDALLPTQKAVKAYVDAAKPDDVEITDATKGLILCNSDGSRYRLTIDTDANGGTIVITKL